MLKSVMGLGEKKQQAKKPAQAPSRKGCMRGKGGPENASCTYKGVRQRTWGKWVAEIREPNRGARLWLGTFDNSREAAVAYDAAARKLYGPNTKLNLPELYAAPTHFHPTSSSSSSSANILIINHQRSSSSTAGSSDSRSSDEPAVGDFKSGKRFSVGDVDVVVVEESRKKERVGGGDEMGIEWGNLNANLPEFDDSAIWAEATATMDFPVMADSGIFAGNFEGWEAMQMQYPWCY